MRLTGATRRDWTASADQLLIQSLNDKSIGLNSQLRAAVLLGAQLLAQRWGQRKPVAVSLDALVVGFVGTSLGHCAEEPGVLPSWDSSHELADGSISF